MVHPELIRLVAQLEDLELEKLSYPYVYGDVVMVKLFVYFRVMGITAFKAMQQHLQARPEVLSLVGVRFPPIGLPYRGASKSCLRWYRSY